ncbi:MAG: hypothetical protein ACFB2Z_11760 [Maricaulaceae bacterium]
MGIALGGWAERPVIPKGAALVITGAADADTLHCRFGDWSGRCRIADFGAPEARRGPHGARCEAELTLGRAAKVWAQTLAGTGAVTFTASGQIDPFGRPLGRAQLGPTDYRTVAAAFGFGRTYVYGEEPRPDWCPPS